MMPSDGSEAFPSRSAGHIEVVPGVFTEPRYLAAWERWSRIKVVSVQEAVSLSFRIEPPPGGHYDCHCWPAERLKEREDLAVMNLGPGGVIEGFGDAKAKLPWVLKAQGLFDAQVVLVSFADWVLSNDMPLAPSCPRSPTASLVERQGAREQQTRARVVGMLALKLSDRLIPSPQRGTRIKVSAVRDAVLNVIERRGDLKGVKRASLDKYIKEGLEALEGDWPS